MKRFTIIIMMAIISMGAYTQNSAGLEQRISDLKDKNGPLLQRADRLYKTLANRPAASGFILKSSYTHKLDSTISWIKDEISGTFEYDWKDEFMYDEQLRSTLWIGKEWQDLTSEWKTYDRTEIEYAPDGSMITFLIYDDDGGVLELETKMEVYIDDEEKPDSMYIYSNEAGFWEMEGKNYYLYNAAGKIVQWDIWGYDEDDGWTYVSKKVFEYNSAGNVERESTYIISGMEVLYFQSEHNYNTSDQLTFTIDKALSFSSGVLENDERTDYQYNAAGEVIVEIESDWEGGAWVEDEKYEYEYGTLNFSDVAFPAYSTFVAGMDQAAYTMGKVPDGYITYDKQGGDWIEKEKFVFYYSAGAPTGIETPKNTGVGFYPNPAENEITLRWNNTSKNLKMRIVQLNGAAVVEKVVSSGERVRVAHLAKGVYLVELLDGNQMVYSGKLMKK